MSHSLLNIQEISSRTFHNEQSIMDTSIEPIEKLNQSNFSSMIKGGNRILSINPDERVRELQRENERYKLTLRTYINRIQQMEGSSSTGVYQKQLMVKYNQKQIQLSQLKQKYEGAIEGLKQTISKNELLHKQIQRLRKKLDENQLSNQIKISLDYSKDHQTFQRSQNLLSNLSIANSNYQIQMVNMKDSLVILEKQNKSLVATNEEYEEKLAMLSQEIERLRGLLETNRRDSEKIKGNNKEQQDIIRKIETDNTEIKNILERLRIQNRDLKNSNSALAVQLQEYHQKLVYKDTLINDLQERESRMQSTLKAKDSRLRDLQSKAEYLQKSTRNIEEQSNTKYSECMQELTRTRTALNQASNSCKKLQIQKEQIVRESKQITIRFEHLKTEYQVVLQQKQHMIHDIEDLDRDRQVLVKEKEYLLKEREQILHDNEQFREGLNKYEINFKQLTEQRTKMNDSMIRHFEEKEKTTVKEYQIKIQTLLEQKNNQITSKTQEVNQYRNQLAALSSQLNNYRSELAAKTTEISQLKQSTLSQSTLIDTTRRDCEEKIKEKKQLINELRAKIQQLQKQLEQSRKEKDMIFHQKNNEVRQYHEKIQNMSKEQKKIQKQSQIRRQDLQNYKRVVNDNEKIIREMTQQLGESQKRTIILTNELQRITNLLQEKEHIIVELNSQYKQVNSAFQERNKEVVSLKEVNEKINFSLSRVEENKGQFQTFIKQIERLNQIVSSKEKQLKTQRLQISKLIQKIDMVYHQQENIIKTIQSTCLDDAKRQTQLNHQLSELKEYIGQLHQAADYKLGNIQNQGGNILDILNRRKKEEENSQFQLLLAQKERQILELTAKFKEAQQINREKEAKREEEQEIYEKIVELTRENTAIREQLNHNNSEYEEEMTVKNQNILKLESKLKQIEKVHKKEVQELKQYINQRQLALTDANQQSRCLKDSVVMKENQYERILFQKQHQIEVLKQEVKDLQQKLRQMSQSIDSRLNHIQQTSQGLKESNKELQKCKVIIKKYEEQLQKYQYHHLEKSRLLSHEKEIEKLQKIIEIRNIQISSNEESYLKLKKRVQQYEKQLSKSKLTIRQLKQTQFESIELHSQLRQLSQEKSQQQDHKLRQISDLKIKNGQLQKELHILQLKLKQSQQKIQIANHQIDNLKVELQRLIQYNSQFVSKIQKIQNSSIEKEALFDRINQLEDEVERVTASWREIQIQYNFIRNNQIQNKMHLRAFQSKNLQLEKAYLKLKQILANINNQNSKLNTKNHFFEVELKKAQIFQQKVANKGMQIQVLNGQLNRLSFENINLNEEVTSCKLALSGQSSEQRKSQEQMGLLVILFAEIETLRNRIKDYEHEINDLRHQRLANYRR